MGVVQLSDDLLQVIDRQVVQGRATSEAEFLAEAVQRYAQALEAAEAEILAAADEGIADIEAGRFVLIDGPDDMRRLRAELGERLNELALKRGSAG
jgi:predicted transcriptional regulator